MDVASKIAAGGRVKLTLYDSGAHFSGWLHGGASEVPIIQSIQRDYNQARLPIMLLTEISIYA